MIVHTPLGFKVYQLTDTLDGGDVLPGFRLPVQDIFVEPVPTEQSTTDRV